MNWECGDPPMGEPYDWEAEETDREKIIGDKPGLPEPGQFPPDPYPEPNPYIHDEPPDPYPEPGEPQAPGRPKNTAKTVLLIVAAVVFVAAVVAALIYTGVGT